MEDGLGLTTETGLLPVVTALACNADDPRVSPWLGPLAPPDPPPVDSCERTNRESRSVPWAKSEALPALYCVTLWTVCLRHCLPAQNVLRVLGTFTILALCRDHAKVKKLAACKVSQRRPNRENTDKQQRGIPRQAQGVYSAACPRGNPAESDPIPPATGAAPTCCKSGNGFNHAVWCQRKILNTNVFKL